MESYVGEIRMFAGNFAPAGWAFCNGDLLSISEYDTLFMLLGTTYGGDGVTTFALPDLMGRIPIHQGKNPASGTTYTLGQKDGIETVTLTLQQLPSHTHVPVASAAASSNSPAGAVWAVGPNNYSTQSPDAKMDPAAIRGIGGNQPHGNMMPFGTISFIISLYGSYPFQN